MRQMLEVWGFLVAWAHSHRMKNISFSDALITYIVFLYSTVAHEAAHAWSAWRLGDGVGGEVLASVIEIFRRHGFTHVGASDKRRLRDFELW